jgi:hypothetical protein
MQRRLLGPVVLWLFLALGVTWVVVRYGVGAVTALSGLVVALVASAPFAPRVRRWWSRTGAPSTTEQVDGAALVLRQTVRRQWTEEAGRRHQFSDDDRMAVRWEPFAGGRNKDGLPDNGSIETLIQAYAAHPWPLIVVGDAGCGKTGLCVLLTLELAARETQRRIPVVFQLSSWDPVENFEKWLLRRLVEDYEFLGDETRWGATADEELLNTERLLPILDGLDELSEEAGAAVLRTIRDSPVFVSPFVLTSRTREFTSAAGGRSVGGKTVLRLLPMDRSAVAGYLRDIFSTDTERWQPVFDDLTSDPDGVVATTLTKPLMLFLARKTYESHASDPAELLDRNRFGTGELIEQHLLDSFVPTVFARQDAPPRTNPLRATGWWGPERARSTLAFLARYLNTVHTDGEVGAAELSWWRLYQLVPGAVFFLLPVVAGAGGCCLICWLVFGLFGHPMLGIVFGLVIGLLGGVAMGAVGPEPPLRFVPRALRRGDLGLRPLLRDAGFGLIGVVSGGFIVGTLVSVPYGAASGLIFGLTFAMVRRFTRPTEPKEPVTPIGVLRSDRAAAAYCWLLGALVGIAVSVFLALAAGLADRLVIRVNTLQVSLLAAGAGVLLGGIGLGMLVQATSAWGHFITTRVWLWLTGATPLRLMSFLEDAHKLGVLRLTGPHFQFRHAMLQQRLAEGDAVTARPTPAHPAAPTPHHPV